MNTASKVANGPSESVRWRRVASPDNINRHDESEATNGPSPEENTANTNGGGGSGGSGGSNKSTGMKFSARLSNNMNKYENTKPIQFIGAIANTTNKAFVNLMNNIDNSGKDGEGGKRARRIIKSRSSANKENMSTGKSSSKKAKSNETLKIESDVENDQDSIEDVFELNDEYSEHENEEIEDVVSNNIKCSCEEHRGKELLNKVYNLTVQQIFDCLFTESDFNRKYWKEKKFLDVESTQWADNKRTLQYKLDLGAFGQCKNFEEQKMIENKPNKCIVIESEAAASGVLYSDYFNVLTRFCITRRTSKSTNLLVTSFMNYKKTPNFIVKGMIEKNSSNTMKDCFTYVDKSLTEMSQCELNERKNSDPKTKKTARKQQQRSSLKVDTTENELEKSSTYSRISSCSSCANHTSSMSSRTDVRLDKTDETQGGSDDRSLTKSSNYYFNRLLRWPFKQEAIITILMIIFFVVILINIRLYIKLLNAETKMEILKNIAKSLEEEGCIKNSNGPDLNIDRWRSFVKNSLQAIQNIESLLKELDTNV